MSSHYKLYTDGGARGNPGPAGIGFVVYQVSPGAEIILEKRGNYLGVATNNQAEYEALIQGLTWLSENNHTRHLDIFMDSLLVVNQIKGQYKVKNQELKPKHLAVTKLLDIFPSYSINHIPRDDNSLADELANQAMDHQS